MRSSYLIALIVTVVGASVYWYQSAANVCPAPLSYRLGDIDPSFNLSSEEALGYVTRAEKLWEDEVNRELFVYDENAEFTISFVYDERQEEADSEAVLRTKLDAQRAENEKISSTVQSLQQQHDSLSSAYEADVAAYEEQLDEYNAEVNKYNDRGGAPEEVYERLSREQERLAAKAASLTETAVKLNKLASEINELGERGNELVRIYNEGVNAYNAEFGFAREFTQGDYQGDRIHVYKFSNEAEVVTVLAHEFGHALGIDHVAGESSLMYYLLEDSGTIPVLSADDRAAYLQVCGVSETMGQKVRRIIRDVLAKV